MDDYPEGLTPARDRWGFYNESFPDWWGKASRHFTNVPRNVAKQWLYRHWGQSPYHWIKSNEVNFELISLGIIEISKIFIESDFRDTAEAIRCGYHLRRMGRRKGELRCKLGSIMERRGTWPVPIIILENIGSFEELVDFPEGLILIEGHRRLEIMRSLISDQLAKQSHTVWLMTT